MHYCPSFFLRKDSNAYWRWLSLYIFVGCATEITGRYLGFVLRENNSWLYNLFMGIEIIVVNLFFWNLIREVRWSRLAVFGGFMLVMTVHLLEGISLSLMNYHSATRSLLSVMMIIYSLGYYYLLIRKDDFVVLRFYAPFWWVAGILFYYSGSIIANFTFMKVNIYFFDKYPLRYFIYIGLNLILYGLWTYSFYCRYRLRKT